MLIELSYPLSERTPFYSALPKPKLDQLYDLGKGDVCNSYYLTTSNHCGTHVDAPKHFCAEGRSITEYTLPELVYTRAAILNVPVGEGELIDQHRLETAADGARHDADLLLLRTGFGTRRSEERRYIDNAPGFGGEGAAFLMERFPQLKALAVDFPSISSPSHEAAGAEAHRVFLGCGGRFADRPILLVEDARLPATLPLLERVFLIPWRFEGLDSAPCTLFAETAE